MKPTVTKNISGYVFDWTDYNVVINVSRIRTQKDDRVTGELLVQAVNGNGDITTIYPPTSYNFSADRTRKELAGSLAKRTPKSKLPWLEMIDQLCTGIQTRVREGEPVIEIWPRDEDELKVDYLLEPVLYHRHPNIMFGEYGSLKSWLSLAIAYIVQLPYNDNNLRLITSTKPTTCLYLDYEDDPSSFRKRWSALERGFGKGAQAILYRRMTSTLSDSVEQLQRIIQAKNIGLVIVDSLGPAARGNLNDTEPAIKYHAALRQLDVTSLA